MPDPRGEATRRVAGLNRGPLVKARMKRILCLRLALRSVEKSWKTYKLAATPQSKADALAEVKRETADVWNEFLAWTAPYSAACRADYRRWTAEIIAMVAA